MERVLGICFVLALASAVACATGAVSDAPDQAIVPSEPGASDSAADAVLQSGTVDASAESAARDAGLDDAKADVEADCGPGNPVQNDLFNPPIDTHWATAGSADIAQSTTNWARLTDSVGSQAGAVWWNASYVFDHFDMTVTFLVSNPQNGGADGMGFAWVPGSDVTRVGVAASYYGFIGLGGYGVVIDTYANPNEPPVPFLALVDGTSAAHLARAALPDVRDALAHTLRVVLDTGKVSAWVDGTLYLQQVAIPGYVPFTGHWGFTASTGGAAETHWIQGITMHFPDGQGCVP